MSVNKKHYDSVVVNKNANVCMACVLVKTQTNNKFMKVFTSVYKCNYINDKSEILTIKNANGDTCSIFSLGNKPQADINASDSMFVATVKNEKFTVKNNFEQLTFFPYHDISFTTWQGVLKVGVKTEAGNVIYGLVKLNNDILLQPQYSNIKINAKDSLIIICNSQKGPNSEDDLLNFKFEKVFSIRKHIELCTKNFIVFKIFEPVEKYVIYNISSKTEKELNAENISNYLGDIILIKQNNQLFEYNLNTNTQTKYKLNYEKN
ncbi:MAG: hypothetical protein JSU07_11900 [Bacteroidetes bacterium]|nr:hypothetical protein [Bacteroidota bacterium]